MVRMLRFIYFIQLGILAGCLSGCGSQTCIKDHCDRPSYCDIGTAAANPDDCTKYYVCNHGAWLELTCVTPLQFDIITCSCNYTDYVDCERCNSSISDVTILSGARDDIPVPCVHEEKYPHKSDCEYYYECIFGDLVLQQCVRGTDFCYHEGDPCVFDIYTSSCTVPDVSFTCNNTHPTSAVFVTTEEPTSREGQTAILHDTTTESHNPFEILIEKITTKDRFKKINKSVNFTEKSQSKRVNVTNKSQIINTEERNNANVDNTRISNNDFEHKSEYAYIADDVTYPITTEGGDGNPPICISDHCERPRYCDSGIFAANPDDCTKYYLCNHGYWLEQNCPPSTKFDIVNCVCNFTQYVECAWCNNTEPDVTILPGMCDNVPEPCEHEVKYPDRSDCEWYYECNSEELSRKQCAKGTDSCHDDTACVFDIHTSSCIPPDGSFNCDYRCLTTGAFVTTEVPTSTEAIVTTLVDPTTSERLTTFEITTEEITTKSKFSTVDASTKVTDKPHTHEPDDLTSTHVDMTETSKKELTTECEHLSNADITTDDVTSPRTSAPEPDVHMAVYILSGACSLLLIILLIIACYYCYKKRHKKHTEDDQVSSKEQDQPEPFQLPPFLNGNINSALWRNDPGLTYETISDKWLPHSISHGGYDTTRVRDNVEFIMNPTIYEELLPHIDDEHEMKEMPRGSDRSLSEQDNYAVIEDRTSMQTNPLYGDMFSPPKQDSFPA